MSAAVDALGLWLADVQLLSAALLAAVIAALALLRQPAQRMAIEKAALGGLVALAALCALPGWSLVHLLAAEAPVLATPIAEPSETPQVERVTPLVLEYDPQLNAVFAPVVTAPAEEAQAAAPPSPPMASAPPTKTAWPTLLVTSQLVGSAGVIAWLALGGVVARRVRRATRPAPAGLVSKLQSIAAIRSSQTPKLLVSDRVATPLALGLRTPAIILPTRLVEPVAAGDVAARDLAAILAHEWAHLAAGDLRTLAVSRFLLVLLWPQPLFWLLRRRLRLDQETLADAAAAEVAGRIDYAQQLLAWSRDVATRGRTPRLAGAVGLWEGPSQLKRRIAALLDEKLTVLRQASRSWRMGTACAALAAAALLSLVTVQRQEAAAQSARSSEAAATAEGNRPLDGENVARSPLVENREGETGDLPFSVEKASSGRAIGEVIHKPVNGGFFDTRLTDVAPTSTLAPTIAAPTSLLDPATSEAEAADFWHLVPDHTLLVANTQASGDPPNADQNATTTEGSATPGEGTTHSTSGIGQVVQADADGVVSVPAPGKAEAATPNTIWIRCLDDTGAALPDVTISFYRVQHRTGAHEFIRDVTTNAAGEVQFDHVLTAEQVASYKQRAKDRHFADDLYASGFMFVARKPGLATTMFGASELEAAVRGYRVDVKLPKAQRLAGRVTAPDGSPVANALVAAGGNAINTVIEGVNAVRTDADGRYEFTDRQPLDGEVARKQRTQLNFYALAADGVAEQPDRPAVGYDEEASRLIVSHPDYAVTRVDAGDIPGTADVTMLPAAAVVGRVVEHGTGAAVADTLVRAYELSDLKLEADGRTVRTIDTFTAVSAGRHIATTQTDANGNYRLANLPAGVYDVWAQPAPPAEGEARRFNRGHSAMIVAAGAEPVAAADLVVGPGALVSVQLVDASTNQPVKLAGGGRVLTALQEVDGPRMQYETQPHADISPDGKFEIRLRPGIFRLAMFVYEGDEGPGSEPAYQTLDDTHAVGPTIDGKHGDTIDVTLKVWPIADLEMHRKLRSSAFKLQNDKSNDRAALQQAVALFAELLTKFPNDHEGLIGRARVYESLGSYGEAIADYQRALEADPGDIGALMYLASLLASAPDSEFRDGRRAVQLATQLVNAMRERGRLQDQWQFLRILAAAQAEAGDFDAAVATQKEAVAAADDERRADMEARLKLYEAGKPYHREAVKLQ